MSQGQGGCGDGEGRSSQSQIPGFSSVTHFSNEGTKRIMGAVRAFQSLPSAGPAWDLQKSYPEFNRAMKNARTKLIPMITSLLKHVNISPEEFRFGDIDEKFDHLVEANDDMLERIGRALDEASGLVRKTETIAVNQSTAAASLRPPGTWGKRKAMELNAGPVQQEGGASSETRQIKKAVYKRMVKEKPQTKFQSPVDNSTAPFVPKLKEKPNSIKPLSILPEYNSKNEEFYGHPYMVELLRWEPMDSMLVEVTPQHPKQLEDTPLIEVTTVRDIEQLLRDLYKVAELAVDLEHHSYRSFLGFTCLIQISTRDKDYIIDAIALRDHLYHLNEIFTNPKIVKVFHGSSSDIEWLQKDFGVYVVNMFDTQVAAKVLGLPQWGLQALLDKYCRVSQDKTFQLADWRIRPLPKDMMHYARQDTHSLLYIYDVMKNELIGTGNKQNNLLASVYEQSKMLCLQRFEKPGSNPKLALRKMRRLLSNRQEYAFIELYKWRDAIAREKDESLAYVLPNHMLLMIAEQLPKEMTGILACCDPVPPLVHSNLGIMHKIITAARDLPLQEHSHEDKSERREKLKDWVILLNSVHDVDEKEITKHRQKVEHNGQEEVAEDNLGHYYELTNSHLEWPLPLKQPCATATAVRPTFTFNSKLRKKKIIPSMESDEDFVIEPTATPFERYQLSKEIIDILKDPQKKEALNMANPVIKAVYETVFLDPSEIDESKSNHEIQQALEKVQVDDEFIPFNPLVTSSKANKRRKRMEDEWDDNNPASNDEEIKESFVIPIQATTDTADSKSAVETFVSVPNHSGEGSTTKPKRKKKGKARGLMNRIRNLGKKVKKEEEGRQDATRGTGSANSRMKFEPTNDQQQAHSSRFPNGSSTPSNRKNTGHRKNKEFKTKFFDFGKRSKGGRSMTFK